MLSPDTEIFRRGNLLIVHRRRQGFVSLPVMALAEDRLPESVVAFLRDVGLDGPDLLDLSPAPVRLVRVSGPAEAVVAVIGSWSDLARVRAETLPSDLPWSVCRLGRDGYQISTRLGGPRPTLCQKCLRHRLLGHDDVVGALWSQQVAGSCVRQTVGGHSRANSLDGAELVELVRSAWRRVADDDRSGIHDGQGDFHPILPFADCTHGGGVRADLEAVTDGVTGPVEAPRSVDGDLPLAVAVARYADPSGHGSTLDDRSLRHDPHVRRESFGAGVTASAAEKVAVLEGMERYSAIRQGHDRVVDDPGSRAHLCVAAGSSISGPAETKLCCHPQEWALAHLLLDRSEVAVPAAQIYRTRTSRSFDCTGMALSDSHDGAVVSGYLEYVEREAINEWWDFGSAAWRIPLGLAEGEVADRIRAFHLRRTRPLCVIEVSTNIRGVHVVVAMSGGKGSPFPLLGMGAAFSATEATQKAFSELGQAIAFSAAERRKWAAMPVAAIAWLGEQSELPEADPEGETPSSRSDADALGYVLELARATGRDPLVVDYDRPEIPFRCVRVLIPQVNGGPTAREPRWIALPW